MDERTRPTSIVLVASSGLVEATGAGDLATMLCAAARCLLPGVESVMPDGDAAAAVRNAGPSARVLVAIGLFNAFNGSKADPPRADGLLGELRRLNERHPEDGAVREQLAKGLNNAIFHCESDFARADGLLDELRRLNERHPEDGAVREQLAKGLFNAFCDSKADPPRADGLLDELRRLNERHPEDGAVRERLAKGLNNAIARSGSDFGRADGLLKELRGLVKNHTKDTLTPALSRGEREVDAAAREQLAKAYIFSIYHATAAKDAVRAADMAEALVPLRETVHSQPGMVDLFKQIFEAALGLAIEQDDTEAERRLRAAREAIFGE